MAWICTDATDEQTDMLLALRGSLLRTTLERLASGVLRAMNPAGYFSTGTTNKNVRVQMQTEFDRHLLGMQQLKGAIHKLHPSQCSAQWQGTEELESS
jgi:hypothetical protein